MHIDSSSQVYEASINLLHKHFKLAREREKEIIAGNDIEHLHQYRVNLRKMRSYLSLIDDAFAARQQPKLKAQLARLMQHTSRLRDLDVHLENEKVYRSLVPKKHTKHLEVLFKQLKKERAQEQDRFTDRLRSPDYKKTLDKISEKLSTMTIMPGPAAEKNLKDHVKPILQKQRNKVKVRYKNINSLTSDADIHALRIECKKLRYLFEFFGSLFNEDKTKKHLSKLKDLQNKLGQFNDYSVQRAFLQDYLLAHKNEGKALKERRAILSLMDALKDKQRDIRMSL